MRHADIVEVFRGIDAAASLKLRQGANKVGELLVFRGIDAAASLKPIYGDPLPTKTITVFRGIDAAASLKPYVESRLLCLKSCFPRHRCRGLIEACHISAAIFAENARFPRHRCRGLIEASLP